MDITVSLPFMQFSTSGSSASLFLFIGFSLIWLTAIFAYSGLSGLLKSLTDIFS